MSPETGPDRPYPGAGARAPGVVRVLGRFDLILLGIVAVVNINGVPPTAVYGRISLVLWVLAFLVFFVPEAVAVLEFSRRYPGEGGIYLWTRREFGEGHGFLAGWCYWVNNLFYVPVMLVYLAGIVAYAGGAQSAGLVESRWFVAAVAFGWLGLMAALNIRGLGVGKWLQNIGGISAALSGGLVLVAAAVAWARGAIQHPPMVASAGYEMITSFSVMCNAFVGIELACTMGDEIRDPGRDLKPAILTAGAVSLASYVLVTWAILALVPIGKIGVIQGIMQALSVGAESAGLQRLIAPVAVVMALAIGGSSAAWFSGTARIPFVAGVHSALPAALGRVHPKWHTPYVALGVCAVLGALFTAISLTGSSVAEAYQVLLKASVVLQMVPFAYLFLGLARLSGVGPAARGAGVVGLVTIVAVVVLAFVPTADVSSPAVFEGKMAVGVFAPLAAGWLFYRRAQGKGGREAAASS
ncbi:MAG: APC family permease [Elusimicrobia bacterium]|nr:APC family permease [Elusimicrobiota bacterium]